MKFTSPYDYEVEVPMLGTVVVPPGGEVEVPDNLAVHFNEAGWTSVEYTNPEPDPEPVEYTNPEPDPEPVENEEE